MDGGKFKRRLSEVNARAVSRGQNELVWKFKMAPGDKVSIRVHVMEYMYIPRGIKRELVRFGISRNGMGYVFVTSSGGSVTIHSGGESISSLSYIKVITLSLLHRRHCVQVRKYKRGCWKNKWHG